MPYSATPVVCVKCSLELVPETNGVMVLELWQRNKAVYKIWEADLVKCPGCGIQMLKGFGMGPHAIHHEGEKFKRWLDLAQSRKNKGECYDLKEVSE